jgi:hypothetical protein
MIAIGIQALLGLAMLLLLFLPACLMIIASVRILKTVRDYSAILVAVGVVLLTIRSLDFLNTLFAARLLDPEDLATYAIYSAYVSQGLSFLGLLLIGVGLLRFSGKARSMVETGP